MGKPMPGITAGKFCSAAKRAAQAGPDGHVVEAWRARSGTPRLRTPWLSMFRASTLMRTALQQMLRRRVVSDRGPGQTRDEDGYFGSSGAQTTSSRPPGTLIGPFEVESAFDGGSAVAEAGVIGVPDPMMGERIKAFVSLQAGVDDDPKTLGKTPLRTPARLRARWAPREIEFSDNLPKTRSGKDHAAAAELPAPRVAGGRPVAGDTPEGDSASDSVELLRSMLRVRRFEERCVGCTARPRSVDSCTFISARRRWPPVSCPNLRPDDAVVATYREHGHGAAQRECRRAKVMAEMYGKVTAQPNGQRRVRCTCST